ncbi:hypothetical protein BD309DRAFT_286181 [Dichomitus squalens]|nr:hypothetical protein BD309DRAFT_286181 [Dichomitus squalens]
MISNKHSVLDRHRLLVPVDAHHSSSASSTPWTMIVVSSRRSLLTDSTPSSMRMHISILHVLCLLPLFSSICSRRPDMPAISTELFCCSTILLESQSTPAAFAAILAMYWPRPSCTLEFVARELLASRAGLDVMSGIFIGSSALRRSSSIEN